MASDKLVKGVIKYTDENSIRETYSVFIGEIAKQVNRKPELFIVPYEELIHLVLDGSVDIGVFTPFAYLDGRLLALSQQKNIEVFAIHKSGRQLGSNAVILVSREANIRSVIDLRGKKFLFTNSNSATGYRVLLSWFRQQDIEPDHHFFDYDRSGDNYLSAQALKDGKVDGIATYLEALNEFEIDTTLVSILWKSDFKIPHIAFVFSPKTETNPAQNIKRFMLGVGDNPVISEKLFGNNPLQIEGWVASNESKYNELRHFINRKRIKPQIVFPIEQHSSIQKEDAAWADVVGLKCYDALVASERFGKVETVMAEKSQKDHFNLFFARVNDQQIDFSLYRNQVVIEQGNMEEEFLFEDLPGLATAAILQYFPIEAHLQIPHLLRKKMKMSHSGLTATISGE